METKSNEGAKLMAIPSNKSKDIEQLLDTESLILYGRTRKSSILRDVCVACGKPATEFKDELSKKEYTISGMCQACQDGIFDVV